MDKVRLFWGVIAIVGMFCPIIGIIVGMFRYRKNKDRVLKEVREDYEEAQRKGGIHTLFYKQEHKRVFAKTFGLPVNVGIIVGLALMIFAFCMMN